MRRFLTILALLFLCGLPAGFAQAETYQLKDGQTMIGEFVSADEHGVLLKLGENKYSERIPWGKFSQSDLKDIGQKNPKAAQFAEPFIELTQDEKIQRKAIVIKEAARLERPAARSLFGALLSSGIGLFIVFILYLANLYAAFEISVYRARPAGLVCGVSAVAPVIGPIIFLSLPMQLKRPGKRKHCCRKRRPKNTPKPKAPLLPLTPVDCISRVRERTPLQPRTKPRPAPHRRFRPQSSMNGASTRSTAVFLKPSFPVSLASCRGAQRKTW